MAVRLNTIFDYAEGILACVCAALDEAQVQDSAMPGCPCRAFVAPGSSVAWDCGFSCEDNCQGQLTVHLAELIETTKFPGTGGSRSVPTQAPGCVPPPWTAAEFVVTLLRCVPTMDEQGVPAPVEDLRNAAVSAMADTAVVYDALACCVQGLTTSNQKLKYQLGRLRTLGPDGGCAGVEARVTIYIPSCNCPETGSIPEDPTP